MTAECGQSETQEMDGGDSDYARRSNVNIAGLFSADDFGAS